jgi:hypothetical protein
MVKLGAVRPPGSPAPINSGFSRRYRLRSPNRQTQFSFICLCNRLGVTKQMGYFPSLDVSMPARRKLSQLHGNASEPNLSLYVDLI